MQCLALFHTTCVEYRLCGGPVSTSLLNKPNVQLAMQLCLAASGLLPLGWFVEGAIWMRFRLVGLTILWMGSSVPHELQLDKGDLYPL